MSILICFALKEEAAPFQKIVAGKHGVSVLLTGIGRRNAGKAACEFLAAGSPKLALTCGFAGALNPDLKIGEIVFETADENLRAKFLAGGAKAAKFFCADRVATTAVEKKKLRDETGADAVEMESAAIQAICREREIPCAIARAISDAADEDLPLDFNALSRPDKNLDFGKLFFSIAKSPGKIPALIKLQRQTQFAAKKLAEILAKIIER